MFSKIKFAVVFIHFISLGDCRCPRRNTNTDTCAPSPCDINAVCTVKCECNEGYYGNGFTCEEGDVCPDGWHEFENSCYFFGNTELNYTVARQFCFDNDATLVKVDSVAENNYLKGKMMVLAQPAYGYLMDLFETSAGNGNEVWRETGAPLNLAVADWNANQPDDNGGKPQTCTMFWKDFSFRWADIECNAIGKDDLNERDSIRLGRALCERPKNV